MKKLSILMLLIALCAGAEERAPLPLPATGEVTLPLAEYNRLTDLAAKSVKVRELPPVAYAIQRADMKMKVGNTSVLGTIALDGKVFSRNATKVSLTNGMTILDAHQENKPLPLEREGGNSVAILPGAGSFAVQLEAGVPLNIETGRASFSLTAPAAGSVRLSLTIPGDRTLVSISPGLITGRKSENGQVVVEATLVPGKNTRVWWATREAAPPVVPKEARFLSAVKTLVSIGESDLKIAALADINVVQGEASQFIVTLPAGYEVTGASGATVESSEVQGGELLLRLGGQQRQQQFLITMERQFGAGKTEVPFISFKGAQRETGEVLVESAGATELTAKESGGLKRMDVKEVNPQLRSLARFPVQAAFRFHRQPNETPALALEWTRFPDSPVLAAVAERAVVTTLVTTEGRSLTEVKLTVKNTAQPYLKVDLPAGASIVTAEVAGEKVKPVEAPDGHRVPLLRNNFRPKGAYEVSFVFMHSGAPFARKGGSELDLPSMDIPISVVEWEVFLPEQYKVKHFGGDAIAMNLLPADSFTTLASNDELDQVAQVAPGVISLVQPGQVGGVVMDPTGAVIAGAKVKVTNLDRGITRMATTDSSGDWIVLGMPAGRLKIEADAQGFKKLIQRFAYNGTNAARFNFKLPVGEASTTVEVTAEAPVIDTSSAQVSSTFDTNNGSGLGNGRHGNNKGNQRQQQPASVNVFNLQKKVVGVLPVRVDVPRAGASYRFARMLVLDEQTRLTFDYKTR